MKFLMNWRGLRISWVTPADSSPSSASFCWLMIRSWVLRSFSRVLSSSAFFCRSSWESSRTRSSCMARKELCRSVSSASRALVISSLPVGSTRYSRSPIPMRRIQISPWTVRMLARIRMPIMTSATAKAAAGIAMAVGLPVRVAWIVAQVSSPMMRTRHRVIWTVLRLGENLDIPKGSVAPGAGPGLSCVWSSLLRPLLLGLLRVILLPGCCFLFFFRLPFRASPRGVARSGTG